MAKYVYDGPVTQFGRCIANKWHGETIAESQEKAIINLEYQFKKKNNTRSLSFASQDDLMDIMNLRPGSVTPLGILNDKDLKVIFYLDKEFLECVTICYIKSKVLLKSKIECLQYRLLCLVS